jgi:Flp pilus assembly protein TadD
VALAEHGDVEDAIAVFSALTLDHPKLPEPYNNLAVLYAARGEFGAARDSLLQAINTQPSYATAHENLGDIYARMAGVAYSRALSLGTGNDTAKHELALIDDLFSHGAAAPSSASSGAALPGVATSRAGTPFETTSPGATLPPEAAVEAIRRWAAACSAQDVEGYFSP